MSSSAKKIWIIIVTEKSQKYPMEFLTSETFFHVKLKLEQFLGVEVERQTLWLNGLELRDDYDIAFYEIEDKSCIYLIEKLRQKGIILRIKTATNTHMIEVDGKDETYTVAQLRNKICITTNAPRDVKLCSGSREMKDDDPVSEYLFSKFPSIKLEEVKKEIKEEEFDM